MIRVEKIVERRGKMTKKDYKSYNVLGEELELEIQQEQEVQQHVEEKLEINECKMDHQSTKDKENQMTEENMQVVSESENIATRGTQGMIIDVEVVEEVAKEVSPYRSVLQDIEDTQSECMSNEENKNQQNTNEEKITSEKINVIEKIGISQEKIKKEAEELKQKIKEKTQDKAKDEAHKDKVQGNQVRDTSFTTYVDNSKNRERGFVEKWLVRLIKLALFIMLLPIIGIVGMGILTTAGVVIGGIVVCIGSGMAILLGTVFVASQLSSSLIALGIAASISAISLGLIVALLCVMLVKSIIRLITNRRPVNRRQKQEKEVR